MYEAGTAALVAEHKSMREAENDNTRIINTCVHCHGVRPSFVIARHCSALIWESCQRHCSLPSASAAACVIGHYRKGPKSIWA
jgi:hypothetical protein